jgi:hypothetical protein
MSQKLNASINVQILGGSSISESQAIEVDAVDNIDVEIDKATGGTAAKKMVEVQPASDPKKVKFLMITTKNYDGKVTYKIDTGTKEVLLDGPQVLVGSGAVGLLEKNPQKIEFSNASSADKAPIKILIGRTAS